MAINSKPISIIWPRIDLTVFIDCMFGNGPGYDTVADGQFCAKGPRQG